MPLDPRAARFLMMIAAGAGKAAGSIAERRLAFAALMRQGGTRPVDCVQQDLSLKGADALLPARLYTPAGREGEILPGLLFFHGGGLVCGDLDTHDGICSRLAQSATCRVASVAYRLAPEHPFPAALQDAEAAVVALFAAAVDLSIDIRRIAIGGDSAGANLAAVTCQSALPKGRPPFKAQLLICPVLDADAAGGSRDSFGEGYFLDRATIARDMAAYLGAAGPARDDPRVSPLRGSGLASQPPTIIHTAEYDPVLDDGASYAARLFEAGVPVRYTCHPGMVHLFYGLGALIPDATAALAAMGEDLRAALI